MAIHVLIVDDDDITRESLMTVLNNQGFNCRQAANGQEALELIKTNEFDVVITDLEMPKMNGIELLEKTAELKSRVSFIIITAYASIETAIEALRKGAFDYLLKPLNFEDVAHRVQKLVEHKELVYENQALRQEVNSQYDFTNIIGESAAIKKVFETIKGVSESESNVLIGGKSGTGKELVAKAIHFNSRHKLGRFVAVNCGAITETLIESELFGYKKGAFTGAYTDKEGLFKAAHRGTLFLDEISEMSLTSQVKLLRAIETKTILSVGSNIPETIHVRIIAATNRDLRQEIEKGAFREDLYYRLNIIEIVLPSLSERRSDIPLLLNHFIQKYNKQMNKKVDHIEPELLTALTRREWQGEVRELENFVERLMIFAKGNVLSFHDLPDDLLETKKTKKFEFSSDNLKIATEEFEREFILDQLLKNNYHRGKTAQSLGIGEATLYRKMSYLGIDQKKPG
ncbi:sigma-54-dependent Fis family transcriptional regulator [candidate division KSB1 bacterium]|nr:sigma-54-dependent Fis family transcriptional regulator [candidate division KSB1 bacterium]